MSDRRTFLAELGLLVLGCEACGGKGEPATMGAVDLGVAPDLASGPDPSKPPPDLAAGAPDLSTGPADLSTARPDLARGPADLAAACSGAPAPPAAGSIGVGETYYIFSTSTFITRDAKGFMAISDICTHAGCGVNWSSGSSAFICPCHRSEFHIDGSVIRGPASTPLRHRPMCRQADGTLAVDYTRYLSGIGDRTP